MLLYAPERAGQEIKKLIDPLDVVPALVGVLKYAGNQDTQDEKEIQRIMDDRSGQIMMTVDDMPEYKELCRGMGIDENDHGRVGSFLIGLISAAAIKRGLV